MPGGESKRAVVQCVGCGAAYAGEVWPDGTIQPIGKRSGCECGSCEFAVVDGADELSL